MTTGIESTEFYLIDNWPGKVTSGPNPADWTVASANKDFPLGTKRMVYDDTNSGWATLMFLKFKNGAVAEPDLGTAKFPVCGMHKVAAASGHYFVVNNDSSEINLAGPIAICLATNLSADTYPYAWFWVGGVCPQDTIPALTGFLYTTDSSVTAGNHMILVDAGDFCVFKLLALTDVCQSSAYSLVTDT